MVVVWAILIACAFSQGQDRSGCRWAKILVQPDGVESYLSVPILLYASNDAVQWVAVHGLGPAKKEVRITISALQAQPQAVQEVELVFGNGKRYTLNTPRVEHGTEQDDQGRSWLCAWSYFNASPEVWTALGNIGLQIVRQSTGMLDLEVGPVAAEAIISAVACVNLVLPPDAEGSGTVAKWPSAAGTAPVVVVSRVYSDSLNADPTEPVFEPMPVPVGDPGQTACMVQRLVAVPHGKIPLRPGQRAISAVLHAFSDPLHLDTFKIITSATEPPTYVLEIVAHSGRLLFKEEILPSGFEQAKPGDEKRQMELDRLRAESILGPWSFGRPMPMDLYRLFIDRKNNGVVFEVTEAEVQALFADPGSVTFSYFADPDQRRLLSYSRSTSRLVNLVPLYP